MTDRCTRRRFLAAGVSAGLASIAGCSSWGPRRETTRSRTTTATRRSPDAARSEDATDEATTGPSERGVVDVRGAIYLPARSFNFYQQWADYDEAVVERDLGYATEVNLNAIRTWASFECWQADPEAHRTALDHFLSTAEGYGMDVLVGLFDFAGQDPTEERAGGHYYQYEFDVDLDIVGDVVRDFDSIALPKGVTARIE